MVERVKKRDFKIIEGKGRLLRTGIVSKEDVSLTTRHHRD